ncbi:PRDM9 [Branchiostoma lanceolatum]|uniref:PRDM9 protein n=1 Tax=Branchiostoma lanceolatum TaxID=7740 RepID=A0A8J9YN57_BRALA|nr:PRDM9 [Branchiostoma lanceolatum]
MERTGGDSTPRKVEHDVSQPEQLFVSVNPNYSMERERVNVHSCPQCGEQYRSQEALQHHVQLLHQAHLEAAHQKVHCNICGQNFSCHHDPAAASLTQTMGGGSLLWQHNFRGIPTGQGVPSQNTNHPGAPGGYVCGQCRRHFHSHHALVTHVEEDHLSPSAAPSYQLPESTNEREPDAQFETPTVTVSQPPPMAGPSSSSEATEEYPCTQCDRMFKAKASLINHLKAQHEKIACAICGLELSNKFSHDRHFKLKHCDQRDFACFQCGKTFKLRDHYKRHMQKSHPATPPYI